MKAYKFLRAGRVAPFTAVVWPETAWVESAAPPLVCQRGVHACRLDQLAYWIADELWEIELGGAIEEQDLQVIATRGRLLRQEPSWGDEARADFALECVRRAAAYAAERVRPHLPVESERLNAAETLEELSARAQEAAAAAATTAGIGRAADLCAYVVDAAGYASEGDTPGTAFVAAHAAVIHAAPDAADPFRAERAEQARWLGRRLGLTEAA